MDEEFKMDIDDLIGYLEFEKIFHHTKQVTRDDAMFMMDCAFDEAERDADNEEDNEEDD